MTVCKVCKGEKVRHIATFICGVQFTGPAVLTPVVVTCGECAGVGTTEASETPQPRPIVLAAKNGNEQTEAPSNVIRMPVRQAPMNGGGAA